MFVPIEEALTSHENSIRARATEARRVYHHDSDTIVAEESDSTLIVGLSGSRQLLTHRPERISQDAMHQAVLAYSPMLASSSFGSCAE